MSASKVAKGFLFSLMQPGQDFFMSVLILRTPGMKNLDSMCERTRRTSQPCPNSECASFTIHFAKMVFFANKKYSDTGSEIQYVINPVHGLDDRAPCFGGCGISSPGSA